MSQDTYKFVVSGMFTGNESFSGTVYLDFDNLRASGSIDLSGGTLTGYPDTNEFQLSSTGPNTYNLYASDSPGGDVILLDFDGLQPASFVDGQKYYATFGDAEEYKTDQQTLISSSVSSSSYYFSDLYGTKFYADGSQGAQNLKGEYSNPDPEFNSFVNTNMAAGLGDVVVDLAQGTIAKGGQLDANLSYINGVQLGADTSTIIALPATTSIPEYPTPYVFANTDVLYGGSGTDTFVGNGATDIIKGGTGTNVVWGGTGSESFYSANGNDVMRGGSANNLMSAGSTSSSTDVFYGNGGVDMIYGHGGAVDLVGGSGSEFLAGGSGFNELDDRQQSAGSTVGLSEFEGSTGTDLFYGGIGTNLIYEGGGTDTFVGSSGTDYVYGGYGRSFTYGGSGTDVVTTGVGNDYVKAGTGAFYFNEDLENQSAGRFDQIDDFTGSRNANIYLPTADQNSTTFDDVNRGTAIVTNVGGGGSAEVFVSGASAASVQAHTHFTLTS